MYRELGVTVIIDPLILQQHHSFEKFSINFDYILCNTVVNWPIVRQMQHKVKTIWWLQEAKVIDHFLNEPEFVPTLSSAKHIIGVSNYSLDMVRKYNRHFTKIYNACYDFYQPLHQGNERDKRASNDPVVFAIVGSIESRKGHDVLFHALSFLDKEIINRMKIQVIGRVLDPAFEQRIRSEVRKDAMIHFTGEISNTEAVKLVEAADVILCPSRDDPFPVVLVEGFCMAKTCVVSDHTGFAELITHGENGFEFKSEDEQAFAAIIRSIVMAPEAIDKIGAKAREVYLRELSIPVLERRLTAYINALPEPDVAPVRSRSTVGKQLSRVAAT
jgi:glycosyltransferase involved in cell wall biosynthesis